MSKTNLQQPPSQYNDGDNVGDGDDDDMEIDILHWIKHHFEIILQRNVIAGTIVVINIIRIKYSCVSFLSVGKNV
jgi:hypothetical protein